MTSEKRKKNHYFGTTPGPVLSDVERMLSTARTLGHVPVMFSDKFIHELHLRDLGQGAMSNHSRRKPRIVLKPVQASSQLINLNEKLEGGYEIDKPQSF